MQVNKKKLAAAVAVGVAAVGTSGVAFGWWSTSGTGSTTTTAGASSNFVVTVSDDATNGALTPGGPTNTVNFTVHNPSTGHQHVSQVVVKVADSNGGAWSAGDCTADDFSLNGGAGGASYTLSGLDVDLDPASASSTADDYSNSVSLQMIDRDANQDACKGVTVPLYVSAS